MSNTCADINKDILNRLARLKGQIEGVEKMIVTGRDCGDIMIQISAVKTALSGLGLEVLKKETQECFQVKDPKTKVKQLEKVVENLFKVK